MAKEYERATAVKCAYKGEIHCSHIFSYTLIWEGMMKIGTRDAINSITYLMVHKLICALGFLIFLHHKNSIHLWKGSNKEEVCVGRRQIKSTFPCDEWLLHEWMAYIYVATESPHSASWRISWKGSWISFQRRIKQVPASSPQSSAMLHNLVAQVA